MTTHVDLAALTDAMVDATARLEYFVDRVTGEVILVSDTLGFIEAGQQRIAMAFERDRFVPVPLPTLDDRLGDLEAFVDTIPDQDLRAHVEAVLDTDDIDTRLGRVLAGNDDLARSWGGFRTRRMRARAAQWLAEQGMVDM